ncbi:uncharacterized protein LOC103517705 [Diaphorina citri]|uniref:Uncharacterized protein LOC103517705 n=1 Tax=Diaphorina citri TaxID=121845 RepID=A0A1S3DG70_DIACI|nr:uncharacterized protein LOC103517705 [Diaphorina citri]
MGADDETGSRVDVATFIPITMYRNNAASFTEKREQTSSNFVKCESFQKVLYVKCKLLFTFDGRQARKVEYKEIWTRDLQEASETHRAEYSKKIEDLTDLVKCLLDQLLFQLDNLSGLDIKFHRFTHDYAQDKKQSNFRIKSVETSQRQFLSDLIRRQRGEVKQLEHLIQYYRHIMDEKKQEIHELENHLGKLV